MCTVQDNRVAVNHGCENGLKDNGQRIVRLSLRCQVEVANINDPRAVWTAAWIGLGGINADRDVVFINDTNDLQAAGDEIGCQLIC